MRLLILSCNTGEGHNSCAKAIFEYTIGQGDSCHVVDSLSFISEKASKFISNWHSRIYRYLPSAFSHGYSYAEQKESFFAEGSPVYKMLTSGTEKMYAYLQEENYDAILCTHVFSALQLTRMLEEHPMDVSTFFIATDYTCSPGCALSKMDKYFIPDQSLGEGFAACGVPADKLIPSGIPVRQMFYQSRDKAAAKQIWGIHPFHRHLLIMCGSMGCGPIHEVADILSANMPSDCHVSIVCGKNERLYKKLKRLHRYNPHIHIHGYVSDMASLMDSADLYLTKPGGISVSEAAAKGLPMVFVNAVAGCESYNLRFFENIGAVVSSDTPKQLADMCMNLLNDSGQIEKMSHALDGFKTRNSAGIVHRCIKGKGGSE